MNPVFRVIVAFAMGIVVFVASSMMVPLVLGSFISAAEAKAWMVTGTQHSGMLVFSFVLMLILGKGRLSGFGFKRPLESYFVAVLIIGILAGVIASVIQSLLPDTGDMPGADFPFLHQVVFIWFYASIAEEFLCRGLMQSFLSPLESVGFSVGKVRLSIPILVSAIFFSLMHLILLVAGVDVARVIIILAFTFVLGLAGGYYRQKTGSLFPAILIHAFGNVGGTLTGLLME